MLIRIPPRNTDHENRLLKLHENGKMMTIRTPKNVSWTNLNILQ